MVFTRASQLPSPEEIDHKQQALLVSNTEKNTSKWLIDLIKAAIYLRLSN